MVGSKVAHDIGDTAEGLAQNISLDTDVEVKLYVDSVLLADVGVLLDVVLHFRCFLLVVVHQVFFGFQILNDFAINLDVLKSAMQDDEHLCSDSPIDEVRDVSFKHEFK